MVVNGVTLDIPGSAGKVQVLGADRIFYKVEVGGEIVPRRRGMWQIPMRDGDPKLMTARGFVPGFQRLFVDGEEVARLGGYVPVLERIVMSLPIVLPILFRLPGVVVGFVMFLMNVIAVKNPQMPRGARIALAIANTVGGFIALLLLSSLLPGAAETSPAP